MTELAQEIEAILFVSGEGLALDYLAEKMDVVEPSRSNQSGVVRNIF